MTDTPELPPTDADTLHRDIMNLPCNVPPGYPFGSELCAGVYRQGHRDARHAAAELAIADRATRLAAVPKGWKLVEDFHVADRVIFGGVEHTIFALGDRPGTFDIQLPSGKGDRWRNVPSSALKYAAAPDAAPAASSPEAADERTLRFAKALTAIAHTTNHCGAEYTALSEVAEIVLREVLPEACAVLGTTCGVTIQHEPAALAAALAGEPAVATTNPPKMTDEAIREWGDRNDLRVSNITDLRCAFEDAQTLHMSEPAVAADEGREKVALDIATWFVNGDRPDEWKLKEWAEALDRDAIEKAYERRGAASQDEQQEKQG